MPVELTVCRLCSRSRPDFLNTIVRLRSAYGNEIQIVELECMAACDDVPAIMIGYDYFPQVTPQDLISQVESRIRRSA